MYGIKKFMVITYDRGTLMFIISFIAFWSAVWGVHGMIRDMCQNEASSSKTGSDVGDQWHERKYHERSWSIRSLQVSPCQMIITLQWRNNERDSVSNHQPYVCLLNRLLRLRWKKTSKLRVTGFCEGNSPVTGEFSAQRASNAENMSIWWRYHEFSRDTWCAWLLSIACVYSSRAVFHAFTSSNDI